MGELVAFYTIAACILGFAVMVVTTKDTVHSVLFLVLDFLFIAAVYVLLGAQFLAAIQILVYAGGIVVLYLFVVMLVNLKRPPEEYRDPRRRGAFRLWNRRRDADTPMEGGDRRPAGRAERRWRGRRPTPCRTVSTRSDRNS